MKILPCLYSEKNDVKTRGFPAVVDPDDFLISAGVNIANIKKIHLQDTHIIIYHS